jgi:hypothetical protein
MAVNLNTNKMVDRVSELHDDVSNTIFSITQDKLCFGNTFNFSYNCILLRIMVSIANIART